MSADETQQLKPTRGSFIRSLPLSVPVDEVIERGREIGLSIQPSDVHSARYYMRQEDDARLSAVPASTEVARVIRPLAFQSPSAQPAPKTTAPAAPAEASSPALHRRNRKQKRSAQPGLSIATVEQELRTIVLRLGSDRVRAMIQTIEDSTLRAVLARRP